MRSPMWRDACRIIDPLKTADPRGGCTPAEGYLHPPLRDQTRDPNVICAPAPTPVALQHKPGMTYVVNLARQVKSCPLLAQPWAKPDQTCIDAARERLC